ncbi:MAG TPA: prevent-host-death protein [Acidisphaera sp.]|nr:prevent-host-death protein [Acidisphaera sp.]
MADVNPDRDVPSPRRVGVREFRGNLTGYLQQVRQGASFLITSHDEVVAEIRPPATAQPIARQPGALRGKIWMAPDFDEWPEDILDAMEGKEE